MFFTFSRIHLRTRYFSIAGAFIFLLWVFFVFRSSGVRTEMVLTVKVVPVASSSRARALPPVAFDSFAYYRTIIDNNLFCPLGWTPPRPVEPYRLIGTGHLFQKLIPSQNLRIKNCEFNAEAFSQFGQKILTSVSI